MTRKLASIVTVALLAVAVLACKEVNRQNSPVRLIVTTDQVPPDFDQASSRASSIPPPPAPRREQASQARRN